MLDPLIFVRAVHFAACTVAMGTIAFALLAAPAATRAGLVDFAGIKQRWHGLALAAFVVAGVFSTVWLILIAGKILDVPVSDVFDDGGFASVALETRFGRIACLRFGLTLVAGALLLWKGPGWPTLAVVTALMATVALTGHAGAGTGTIGIIHVLSDVVHLVAAGTWLGTLPALAWLLWWCRGEPARAGLAANVTRRFGEVALIAVAALLASGMVNTAILVGWPADPLATTYAQALALKVALFAAMLALGAVNRFWLTPALPRPGALSALTGMVCAETLLGIGALLLVGLLGTQPPAAHVHSSSAAINRDAAFVHIHTSEVMADLTIDPGRTGTSTATIRLWHEDYRPYAAEWVRLRLEPKMPGAPAVERDTTRAQDGTWIADNVQIQMGGEWVARLVIGRDGKAFVLDGTILLAQCSNEC